MGLIFNDFWSQNVVTQSGLQMDLYGINMTGRKVYKKYQFGDSLEIRQMATKSGDEKIKDIELSNWEEFEEEIEKEHAQTEKLNKENTGYISDLLFRGHANRKWHLLTTLERFSEDKNVNRDYSWRDYDQILHRVHPAVSSLTSNQYELEEFKIGIVPVPPSYDFMIYLRQHGFPSPLLDWTRSPYVAAFFAFDKAAKADEEAKDDEETNNDDVAIFSYREWLGKGKVHAAGAQRIEGMGKYVKTHRRHYLQQCQYTICIRDDELGVKGEVLERVYCSYEEVKYETEQNVIKKYIIPCKERKKVMRKLDLMNINAFSLFGNEEGLASMLAYREIEMR